MTIVRTDASLRDRRLIATKLPLDGLAEVLQQMRAVSNLPRLRRALACGLRVETRTIAAHHVHARMLSEPTGGGRRRTIRQHVNHLTALEVNDDRAVVGTLPPRPVVDASYTDDDSDAIFRRSLARCFRLVKIVMSLTGIPSLLISRSEGRPPALWPSRRTISARRVAWRESDAARPGRRSAKMRRSHFRLRHLQRPRRARTMTVLERTDPEAFVSRCCGANWTVRRIPGRGSAAGCPR